ncbi:MAG: recombinase family protein [Acidobacteriia bacterium]|nr:recombinase family protein [Terriglobia bacterium]
MKSPVYFGYIRVSTAKQGEHGVSLQEQRAAIERYAQHNQFPISQWFEERQTAAKRGRSGFTRMLKLLRSGKAQGVIIHKIDRSARNLKDWADLGELIDQGIEVRFANESLDLHSRGGRLSADIQAVVAADFIRNLREETKKGIYGRLKQGLYPRPAPLGYVDQGQGRPKALDATLGPVVRQVFELYASGQYTLLALQDKAYAIGLRNRNGRRVSFTGLSSLLHNPFYMGLIRIQRTGETFPGIHSPLISKSLFDRVQDMLQGRTRAKTQKYAFVFRKLFRCKFCDYAVVGETHKGHVYYRCHTRNCQTKYFTESAIENAVLAHISPLQLNAAELAYLESKITTLRTHWTSEKHVQTQALQLRLGKLQERLARLTDAYLDQALEKDLFEERKTALLMERKDVEESLAKVEDVNRSIPDELTEFLELLKSAPLQYKLANPDQKRELLQTLTSNRQVAGKNVELVLKLPLAEIAKRQKILDGDPSHGLALVWDPLFERLVRIFSEARMGLKNAHSDSSLAP